MTKIIHPIAGALALLTIATFWLSTVFAESYSGLMRLSPRSRRRSPGAFLSSFRRWRLQEARV